MTYRCKEKLIINPTTNLLADWKKQKNNMKQTLENVVRTNVLRLINKHEVSLQEMSREIMLDPAHLSRIISGKRNFTLRHLELFAKFFQISVSELVAEPKIHYQCTDEQHIIIEMTIPNYDTYKRLKTVIESLG